MKNRISKYVILAIIMLFSINVKADSINEIEMKVYLDNNGNAIVEEVWDASITKGTEGYRPFSKLDNITITDFTVTDDTGVTYESLEKWNVNASFTEKSYKSGINYTNNGLELCWGISNYGNKKYILKYKINNLVTQYTDNQGIYFNFLNLKQKIKKVKITLYADFLLSLDNARIWSFGNNGTINFNDGKIIMEAKDGLSATQYIVIMVRFSEKLFETNNISTKSFDNIYNEAFEGVNNKPNTNNSNKCNVDLNNNALMIWFMIFGPIVIIISKISCIPIYLTIPYFAIIIGLIVLFWKARKWSKNAYYYILAIELTANGILFSLIMYICDKIGCIVNANHAIYYPIERLLFSLLFIGFLVSFLRDNYIKKSCGRSDNKLSFGLNGKVLPKDKDIIYYRYIPCNNDLKYAYWLAYEFPITRASVNKGIIGAYILKWINSNDITALYNNVDEDKKEYYLDFSKETSFPDKIENELYQIIKKAAGENHVLESNEFKEWSIKNYKLISDWLFDIDKVVIDRLEKENLISVNGKIKEVNNIVREDAIKLKGLKKYLDDFSVIGLREPPEVRLWGEYLIFAELLGIADKVREGFKKIYPSLDTGSVVSTMYVDDAILSVVSTFVDSYSQGSSTGYSIDHPDSDYSGDSSSSGGGGSSSSSGGSSAGGASGGGFR